MENVNSSDKEVDMEGYNFNNHRDPSSFSQPGSFIINYLLYFI